MNHKPFMVSHHASSLRRFLMAEHLGLLDGGNHDWGAGSTPQLSPQVSVDLQDPVCCETWQLWCQTSSQNTAIYDRSFPSQPCNTLRNSKQLVDMIAAEKKLLDTPSMLIRTEQNETSTVPICEVGDL